MKKIVWFLFLCISAYANSVQVFTTNTMHLNIDNNIRLEKLFVGTTEEYDQQAYNILSSDTVKKAVGESALAVVKANANTLGSSVKDMKAGGGILGAGIILGMTAVMGAYNYATEDFFYLYLAKAVNENNESTLIYSLIVSNSKLENGEVEKLAIEKIKA